MDSQKLVVKFFLEDPSSVKPATLVPVFHSFIQTHAIPDHLLIDVADYQHVHQGPGTVLVAHEANFYMDNGEGRPGLLYQRKQPLAGTSGLRERIARVLAAALRACARLEEDPAFGGGLRFRTDEVVFRVNDRLLAPNTPETYRAVEPGLREIFGELFAGQAVTLEPRHSPLTLFEVRVRTGRSIPVRDLLARAESLAASPALSR
jgi:hypothetical protein